MPRDLEKEKNEIDYAIGWAPGAFKGIFGGYGLCRSVDTAIFAPSSFCEFCSEM
jgi:hypothetical protein